MNDFGTQIQRFGESLPARAKGQEPPEDGYQGEYVTELAAADRRRRRHGRRGARPPRRGADARRRSRPRSSASACTWTGSRARAPPTRRARCRPRSRSCARARPHLPAGRRHVAAHHHLRRRQGPGADALHRRGDLLRAPTSPTTGPSTSAATTASIDVVGADHHGYQSRVTAAWQALGGDPAGFEVVIMQLVNLLEGGRAGADVQAGRAPSWRWTTCWTTSAWTPPAGSCSSAATRPRIDLDLELARRQSQDNPVYYAQYAHARIASILRKAGDERVAAALAADVAASAEQLHPSARALVKRLAAFPGEVRRRRRPPRAAPDDHLRDRAGPGLLGLLPRLQGGGGGRGGRRRGPADRAERGHAPDDRALAGPAGGIRAPTRCSLRARNSGACHGLQDSK